VRVHRLQWGNLSCYENDLPAIEKNYFDKGIFFLIPFFSLSFFEQVFPFFFEIKNCYGSHEQYSSKQHKLSIAP
jgi:hypothetical protein